MTVTRPERPLTPLEVAKQHVEHALDERTAKRLNTFRDGTFYIEARWAAVLSWLVDFVVFLVCVVAGIVALAAALPDATNSTITFVMIGLLFGMPLVLGLFYGNGRALGAVLTGTRLVRAKNGDRVGWKAPWAMLVRTILFPALLVAVVMGGGIAPGDVVRISIDDAATRRLRAAGFLRLPEGAPRT
jgi:hypothetical protein